MVPSSTIVRIAADRRGELTIPNVRPMLRHLGIAVAGEAPLVLMTETDYRLWTQELTYMTQERLTESREKTKPQVEHRESRPAPARWFPRGLRPILQLQHTIGNYAVGRLIQAEPTVSHPGDSYERRADRVAEQVTRMSATESTAAAQCQMIPDKEKDKQPLQTKLLAASVTPLAQRQMIPEEEKEEEQPVQMKSTPQRAAREESVDAGITIEQQLGQSSGKGSSLPESVRAYMEPRFGADFSSVRVHTGSEASTLNRSLSAQA